MKYIALAQFLLIVLLVSADRLQAEPKLLAELPSDEKDIVKYETYKRTWIEFSPDGSKLFVRYGQAIRIWSTQDWKSIRWEIPSKAVPDLSIRSSFAFDPKGATLYYLAANQFHSRPVTKDEPAAKIDQERPNGSPIFQFISTSRDGKELFFTGVNAGRQLGVYRCPLDKPAKLTEVFKSEPINLASFALSADGKLIAFGNMNYVKGGKRYAFEVWSTDLKVRQLHLEDCPCEVGALQFSPDGSLLAVGGDDGTLSIYNMILGQFVNSWTQNHSISTIDFHPKRSLVAYTVRDSKGGHNLQIGDLASKKLITSRVENPCPMYVRFSPDGKMIAVMDMDCVLKIWDVDSLIQK